MTMENLYYPSMRDTPLIAGLFLIAMTLAKRSKDGDDVDKDR